MATVFHHNSVLAITNLPSTNTKTKAKAKSYGERKDGQFGATAEVPFGWIQKKKKKNGKAISTQRSRSSRGMPFSLTLVRNDLASAPSVGKDGKEEEEEEKVDEMARKKAPPPPDEPLHAHGAASSHHVPPPKRIAFDYGFQAKFLRKGPSVPGSAVKLAFENFGREWRALRRSYLFGELEKIDFAQIEGGPLEAVSLYLQQGFVLFLRGFDKLLQLWDGLPELKPEELDTDKEREELRQELKKLKLSNDAVWERERSRPAVEAPWWILVPYYLLCTMLDVIFKDRPIQRFWFLETVARMPYFSYISMLHLYETLGWWRVGAEVRKVHFAEEWNEMHHLKIMESLGGDLAWGDRFFGQHAAFFYYWILNFMFLVSPKVAYNFSELIEMHAVDTYGQFVDDNEEILRRLPPPPVAVEYYESDDLYMYDEFQTSRLPETRRPKIESLYDVFSAIAGDEYEHVKTMVACQQLKTAVRSPHRTKPKGQNVPD